jgi:RNA polymerase sigma factor (sigma-70 family)
MQGRDWLAERFEEQRGRLRMVAYRMLGSSGEADDAVQEAWLRLSRSGAEDVENLGGWLTTVVARVCLDMLRSRRARREDPLESHEDAVEEGLDPEHQAVLGDSVGLAMLVVLDTLTPAERLAFVLHDMFGVSFEEIEEIVGRTPDAARQLASRARRRVQGAHVPDADLAQRRVVVDAFLAASREGDFEALLALLDPDVVLRADATVVAMGGPGEVLGAAAVAETFKGRARVARPVLVDGSPGAVWMAGGSPRVVFAFAVEAGRIVEIEMLGDPDRLRDLELVSVGD